MVSFSWYTEILEQIEGSSDLEQLERLRVSVFGRKGLLTLRMRELSGLPQEERRERGTELNTLKERLEKVILERRTVLEGEVFLQRIEEERVDVSLPVRPGMGWGRLHPITQTTTELSEIFADMGFRIVWGPDIESEYYNFTALNIPEEHPARQMHDTFYLESGDGEGGGGEGGGVRVLRTHTSPVQIRTLLEHAPPVRIIAPGRTYRCDQDMTHTPMFHQVEGLVVDESTHMGHLKGCIIDFCQEFFGVGDLPVRFRPSYFPFTEPSAEVDIGCSRREGKLVIGSRDDWLEIMGCGMIHPQVLENCGIDSKKYQGFAFGMGIERITMLKYGIPDLRTFFDNDVRWLKHYGFSPI